MFRWDKWFSGALFAGVIGAGGLITAALADQVISSGEWYLIGLTFVGCLIGWMKQHPPEPWDGTDRRGPETLEGGEGK